jgi:arylsulfatase A-like enzyme
MHEFYCIYRPPLPNGYHYPYSFHQGSPTLVTPSNNEIHTEYLTDRLTNEVLSYIDTHVHTYQNKLTNELTIPFFTYISHYGVHGPFDHKEEYTKLYMNKYNNMCYNTHNYNTMQSTTTNNSNGNYNVLYDTNNHNVSSESSSRHTNLSNNNITSHHCNSVMASMLQSIDDSLGSIIHKLTETNIIQNTIVLFTSDNGGVHRNNLPDVSQHIHSRWVSNYIKFAGKHTPPTSNWPLKAGKGYLYEGGVRVPLIIAWGNNIRHDSISHHTVSSIDIFPTLMHMIEHKSNDITKHLSTIDGKSFMHILIDNSNNDNIPLKYWTFPNKNSSISHLYSKNTWWRGENNGIFNIYPHGGLGRPPAVSVRYLQWKLIRFFHIGIYNPNIYELYDLESDISEMNNLAYNSLYADIVTELDAFIDRFLVDTKVLLPIENPLFNKIEFDNKIKQASHHRNNSSSNNNACMC